MRCVLSGSFHRDLPGLESAYLELTMVGCQVLSPHRLFFGDTNAQFVKDSAEDLWTPHELERHHLLAISQAHFLWVHASEGYVGHSVALEVGFAYAKGIPIFSKAPPSEPLLCGFIGVVPSVFLALEALCRPI